MNTSNNDPTEISYLESLTKIVIDNYIGDYASIIGLLITLIGFAITIYNVKKSRSSSEEAKNTVAKIQNDLRKIDIVAELTSAINLTDEIKTLQRTSAWELVPEKYSKLRKHLISIRESTEELDDTNLKHIQSAITQSASSERNIDEQIKKKETPDSAKLNSLLSKHADNLQSVLIGTKIEIGKKYEL